METEIHNALKVLRKGGIILYPTDTIWGIGCDATNTKSVARIYQIKKRNDSKALISLIANKHQLKTYTKDFPKEAENITPTTIIYKNTKGLAKNLLANNGSAAIRIVKDEFCYNLITQFGKAIVSTSANVSQQTPPNRFSEITKEIIDNVDYIVNLRKNEIMSNPSKILEITPEGNVKKIR